MHAVFKTTTYTMYIKLSEAVTMRPFFFFDQNMAESKDTDTTRVGE